MKRFLPLLLLVLTLASCRTFNSGDAYRPDEPLAVSAKMNLAITTSRGNNQSVGGTLRMRRDEAIQISLSKFGIEGVRLIFTPDQITVLDRINKRSLVTTYEQFFASFPDTRPLTFAALQRFFWGEDDRPRQIVETSLGSLFPFQLNIEQRDTKSIRGYRIPRQTRIDLEACGGEHQLRLALSNLKINYNWNSAAVVPSNYKPYDSGALMRLIPKLIQ